MKPDERGFEDAITTSLVGAGGYGVCKWGTHVDWAADFDSVRALDTAELFAFLAGTQPKAWERLVAVHGGEAGARAQFADRLAKQIDERGTVDVLRHGVNDHGVEVRLAYFKPAHGLTPELNALYDANRLSVTRQLPYEPAGTKTLDLALFVNGIPVATAELKNPLTHQTVEHAKHQYRTDRDPANATLRRALVHFAVDPDTVEMTTRLDGPRTRFLPFNRGNNGGRGNAPDPAGHRTRYLWEQLWARDAWLDILARFIHVIPGGGATKAAKLRNGTVIFPRYHQWDAVRRLEATARAEGPGRSYLVQHSAGSGKSNTIAWLAHRLMSLHGADDKPVFDKVVVITDRVILDRQLQETIYQFEHATGVVARIDADSTQLATALSGEQSRIVITTLQKFPFILDKVTELGKRRFAVIVDEAHSLPDRRGREGAPGGPRLHVRRGGARGSRGVRARSGAPATRRTRSPRSVAARGRQPNIELLRLHRHAQGPNAGAVRPARTPTATTRPSTCTRCARRSRRASSSTCSPTTRRTPCTGRWARRSRTTPSTTPARRSAPSPAGRRSTRTTSPRRPSSSWSTSATTPATRSAAGGRRWS